MKQCQECGFEMNDEYSFCPKCGKRIDVNKRCDKCGNVVDDEAVFCGFCGNSLNKIVKPKKKCNKENIYQMIKKILIISLSSLF